MPVEADNKADISPGAGQTRGIGSEDGEASGQQGHGGPGAFVPLGAGMGRKLAILVQTMREQTLPLQVALGQD